MHPMLWRLGTTHKSVMVIVQHSTASWEDGFVNCMIYSQRDTSCCHITIITNRTRHLGLEKAGMTNRVLLRNKRANIQIKSEKRVKGQWVTKGNNSQKRNMYITSKSQNSPSSSESIFLVPVLVLLRPRGEREKVNLLPRALFLGLGGGVGKGPGIGRSHDHQTPRICGCTKLAYDHIR